MSDDDWLSQLLAALPTYEPTSPPCNCTTAQLCIINHRPVQHSTYCAARPQRETKGKA
jgi:hypothetical protein